MAKNKEVTVSASKAAAIVHRFASVEAEAQRIHTEQTGAKLVRAMLNGGSLHAVITDGKATIEVCDGKVALSVGE